MKNKHWPFSAIGLICLLFLFCSCATSSAVSQSAAHTHALTVVRTTALDLNRFPPFSKTIDDPGSASRLYHAMLALPHFQGVYNCPNDNGLRYQLTFDLKGVTTQQILVSASGCRSVALKNDDVRMVDDTFWSLFSHTLAVPNAELFPLPVSS